MPALECGGLVGAGATLLVMPERSGALWMVTTVGLPVPGIAGSSEATGVVISLEEAKAWFGICVPLANGEASFAVRVTESLLPAASGLGQVAVSAPEEKLAVPPLLALALMKVSRESSTSVSRTLVAGAVPSLGIVRV